MRETWLRPNRRALWFGSVPPLVVAALGAWLAWGSTVSAPRAWQWIVLVAALAAQLVRPRVAYLKGHVLFYLRAGRPIAVPVAIVEAFFVGRGPTTLPGALGTKETMNLVARLAERETDWARRDVKRSLGSWCDSYVTIRGTWCEPLEPELIRRLNRRLKEVKTELEIVR
jgi:hypothetical protein